MNIPTLQDEWRKYRDAAYPRGTSATQNRETHQAFFAGLLIAFELMRKVSTEIPDEDMAVAALAKLEREAHDINAQRAFQMRGVN